MFILQEMRHRRWLQLSWFFHASFCAPSSRASPAGEPLDLGELQALAIQEHPGTHHKHQNIINCDDVCINHTVSYLFSQNFHCANTFWRSPQAVSMITDLGSLSWKGVQKTVGWDLWIFDSQLSDPKISKEHARFDAGKFPGVSKLQGSDPCHIERGLLGWYLPHASPAGRPPSEKISNNDCSIFWNLG